jgi:hypothetical protein
MKLVSPPGDTWHLPPPNVTRCSGTLPDAPMTIDPSSWLALHSPKQIHTLIYLPRLSSRHPPPQAWSLPPLLSPSCCKSVSPASQASNSPLQVPTMEVEMLGVSQRALQGHSHSWPAWRKTREKWNRKFPAPIPFR